MAGSNFPLGSILTSITLMCACACSSGSGYEPYVLAEEMTCDRYVTQIDRARAKVVKAYDSVDQTAYRTKLEDFMRECDLMLDSNMRGYSCSYHMSNGGRSTSPKRYSEAARLCLEGNEMYKGLTGKAWRTSFW